MKRILVFLAVVLLLSGCGTAEENRIQISILESGDFAVEQNGLWVEPGGDAVFRVKPEPGLAVAGTDYDGQIHMEQSGDWTELTVRNVRYPTRLRLRLTEQFARITYDANDGTGDQKTVLYDKSLHSRPNTENGRDLFVRERHTLFGWNTSPDGTGQHIGLGSRVDAGPDGITLYAQWAKWNPESDFTFTDGVYLTVTGYQGNSDPVVIPERIGGKPVGAIAHNAFRDCKAGSLILPPTLVRVAEGAFENCDFESVTIFDSIETISNSSFRDCGGLRTLRINAFEPPFGYLYRKESIYADKVDLLIEAAGEKKLVFYSGCSVWYNLDAPQVEEALKGAYRILNLGLNGIVNSALQMQILTALMEPGDILFHTPELASRTQMMERISMDRSDDILWCGLENNYDLVALADFRTVPGLLESFCAYLDEKDKAASPDSTYRDSQGRTYLDGWGSIPFERTQGMETLPDAVYLDPDRVKTDAMERLGEVYSILNEKGIRVYVGYACVNLDAVPEEQRGNAREVDEWFRAAVSAMDGPVLISRLEDYLYRNPDFYDTNYHLLSEAAERNTEKWLRDLRSQMETDGIGVGE